LNPPDGVELIVFSFIVNGLSEAAEDNYCDYGASKCSLAVKINQKLSVSHTEEKAYPSLI